MSTNKTQNYNLHSWVPGDDFLRSEFNDNFTGIDTALNTLSTAIAAEATARQQAITAEQQARQSAITAEQNARTAAITALTTAKAEIVIGSYTGNRAEERIINLGFQPKAVLLVSGHGKMWFDYSNYSAACGGLFFPGHPLRTSLYSTENPIAAEIVSNGFKVYYRGCAFTNDTDEDYYYLAVK